MLKHPEDCSKDQLDVRIVVLLVLGLLLIQLGVLSGGFTLAYAIPFGVITYGLIILVRTRSHRFTRK